MPALRHLLATLSLRSTLIHNYTRTFSESLSKNWDEKSLEEELSFFLNAGHLGSFVVH